MSILLIRGDARQIPLADNSIDCCVTSPPYWGLRDYGVAGQLGLEETPEEYIAVMVEVFREVRRVLRKDGTLWLNMGDSYAGSGHGLGDRSTTNKSNGASRGVRIGSIHGDSGHTEYQPPPPGLKCKDLVGVPWALAFALRTDGWYLRSDIIWSKPNPMPESVTDRPTKSHEYIFLLSKSERYFYNQEAILEKVSGTAHARGDGINPKCYNGSTFTTGKTSHHGNVGQGERRSYTVPAGWNTGARRHDTNDGRYPRTRTKDDDREDQGLRRSDRFGRGAGWRAKQNASFSGAVNELVEARNKRTVWEIPTQAFPEAHFATFPEDLIKPCILAGCPEGGTVFDPFMGSGTTILVARDLQCHGIGLELNAEYLEIAKRRLSQEVFDFSGAAK